MKRLLFPIAFITLAVLVSACGTPPCPNAEACAEMYKGIVTQQIRQAPITAEAADKERAWAETERARPPAETATALALGLAAITNTQVYEGATSTRGAEATQAVKTQAVESTNDYQTAVAVVATNEEAGRRAEDARKLYNEAQAQKELDSKFWPVFWRVFWPTVIVAIPVLSISIAVLLARAKAKKERAEGDAAMIRANAEAQALITRTNAEAAEIMARAQRWRFMPTHNGIVVDDDKYTFIQTGRVDKGPGPSSPTPALAPVPELPQGAPGPFETYDKPTAEVLDFLDRCIEIKAEAMALGGEAARRHADSRLIPSAAEINNSTLRDAGLIPLANAGLVSTETGRGKGTRVLGYDSVSALRAAIASGLVKLPHDAESIGYPAPSEVSGQIVYK